MTDIVGTLYRLVLDLCSHQYLFQIHPERFRQAGDLDHHSIRIGVGMVFHSGFARIDIPLSEAKNTAP